MKNKFKAGRLSRELQLSFWRDAILEGFPDRDLILENLEGMRPSRYFKHVKGGAMAQLLDFARRVDWKNGDTRGSGGAPASPVGVFSNTITVMY